MKYLYAITGNSEENGVPQRFVLGQSSDRVEAWNAKNNHLKAGVDKVSVHLVMKTFPVDGQDDFTDPLLEMSWFDGVSKKVGDYIQNANAGNSNSMNKWAWDDVLENEGMSVEYLTDRAGTGFLISIDEMVGILPAVSQT